MVFGNIYSYIYVTVTVYLSGSAPLEDSIVSNNGRFDKVKKIYILHTCYFIRVRKKAKFNVKNDFHSSFFWL